MSVARGVAHFVALVSLVGGLAGCGQVGYRGALPPAHTRTFATENASPPPAGVDVLTALQQRPVKPPVLPPDETCSASSSPDLGGVAPNYGPGARPVYLSAQNS